MEIDELQELVAKQLAVMGMSARQASLLSVGRADFVRDIKNGSMPSFDKALSLLGVLGLSVEFHERTEGIAAQMVREQENALPDMSHFAKEFLNDGLLHSEKTTEIEMPPDGFAAFQAGQDAARDAARWREEVDEKLILILKAIADMRARMLHDATVSAGGAEGQAPPGDKPKSPDAIAEPVMEYPFAADVRAAAGAGEMVFDDSADFRIAIPAGQVATWADHASIVCLRVVGESMVPTLAPDAMLAVDRSQTEPIKNQIFVIHTEDGLVVKRLNRASKRWQLLSDNPARAPRMVEQTDRIVGRVAWSGSLMGGGKPQPKPNERDTDNGK